MKAFAVLLKNELKLNIRNMNMVIFAVILPLVMLGVLSLLYGTEPAAEGAAFTFMEQSIGALCAISICAGALMGLPLAVSEYRERKILKRFRVTPIHPAMLLAVECCIYVLYAAASLATLIPAAMLLFGVAVHGSWMAFLLSWLLTLASSMSLGMMVGGLAPNAKTASVAACLLYFPVLIFSGATLPFEVMPQGLQRAVLLFPMAQGIRLMKAAFLGTPLPDAWISVLIMLAVAVVCTAVAVRHFKWE